MPCRAPEIEANSVSENFNGTLLCMVAMVARNYLDASGANVNPSENGYATWRDEPLQARSQFGLRAVVR
jgi:hypothetical protein